MPMSRHWQPKSRMRLPGHETVTGKDNNNNWFIVTLNSYIEVNT